MTGLPQGEVQDYAYSEFNVLFLMDDGAIFAANWGSDAGDRETLDAIPLFRGQTFAAVYVDRRGPTADYCGIKASGITMCLSPSTGNFQFELSTWRLAHLSSGRALIVSADSTRLDLAKVVDETALEQVVSRSVEQLGFAAGSTIADVARKESDCMFVLASSGEVRSFVINEPKSQFAADPNRLDDFLPYDPIGAKYGCLGPPRTTPWTKK